MPINDNVAFPLTLIKYYHLKKPESVPVLHVWLAIINSLVLFNQNTAKAIQNTIALYSEFTGKFSY